MDMLKELMGKQLELQTRLGTNFSTMTNEERAAFMRDHRGYVEDEIAEALYEMPGYKMWKDYSGMSDEARHVAWQKVRMELIDALHFFMNLMLCAGMTAEEVHYMYMAKNKENHRRQDEGYTSDVSYREQGVDEVVKPTCTVCDADGTMTSENFVALIIDEDGKMCLSGTAGTLALGVAVNLLYAEYTSQIVGMPEEELDKLNEAIEYVTRNIMEDRHE